MIEVFIATLPLFAASYLICLLASSLLALSGFILVGKKQEFLGATMSQASMFGISLILVLDWVHSEYSIFVVSIIFACLTAFGVYSKSVQSYASSITAYLFILFSASVMVIIALSPHGMEELKVLSSSTLIGASWTEVYWMLTINMVVLFLFYKYQKHILLHLVDPQFLSTCRINYNGFNFCIALALGVVVGTCLKVSGFLFTFGYLILPALCAKNLVTSYFKVPWLSIIIALICSSFGIFLSTSFDLPPAASCVLLLSVIVPITILIRNIQRS